MPVHPLQQHLIGVGLHLRDNVASRVEGQMHMRVNKTGQQRDIAKINYGSPGETPLPARSTALIRPPHTTTSGAPAWKTSPSNRRAARSPHLPPWGMGARYSFIASPQGWQRPPVGPARK